MRWVLTLVLATWLVALGLLCCRNAFASDKDCANFTYQEDAQSYFTSGGGSRFNNVDNLDADGNGFACEALPHRSTTTAADSTLPLPQTSSNGDSGISRGWIIAILAACGGAIWFYFAEIRGPGNQRAVHPENLPYNTKTMPYVAYLKTPEWAQIRKMALDRDGNQCTKCGSRERLQAHHLTYARRGYEKLKDLQTLCKTCHETKHQENR